VLVAPVLVAPVLVAPVLVAPVPVAPALALPGIGAAELVADTAALATGRSSAPSALAEGMLLGVGGALCVGATPVVRASCGLLESWHPTKTLMSSAEPNKKNPNRQRLTPAALHRYAADSEEMRPRGCRMRFGAS